MTEHHKFPQKRPLFPEEIEVMIQTAEIRVVSGRVVFHDFVSDDEPESDWLFLVRLQWLQSLQEVKRHGLQNSLQH